MFWAFATTFVGRKISLPDCDFGPRTRHWDLVDINAYAKKKKGCDSARQTGHGHPDPKRFRAQFGHTDNRH